MFCRVSFQCLIFQTTSKSEWCNSERLTYVPRLVRGRTRACTEDSRNILRKIRKRAVLPKTSNYFRTKVCKGQRVNYSRIEIWLSVHKMKLFFLSTKERQKKLYILIITVMKYGLYVVYFYRELTFCPNLETIDIRNYARCRFLCRKWNILLKINENNSFRSITLF